MEERGKETRKKRQESKSKGDKRMYKEQYGKENKQGATGVQKPWQKARPDTKNKVSAKNK